MSAKENAHRLFTMMGAEVTSTFSLPSFKETFNSEKCKITDKDLDKLLQKELQTFTDRLK